MSGGQYGISYSYEFKPGTEVMDPATYREVPVEMGDTTTKHIDAHTTILEVRNPHMTLTPIYREPYGTEEGDTVWETTLWDAPANKAVAKIITMFTGTGVVKA